MQTFKRAGTRPGPFALLLVACVGTASVVLRAHDPGLSALDVTIVGSRVTATLSLSAPDAEFAALAWHERRDATLDERDGPSPVALRTAAIATASRRLIEIMADERRVEPIVERAWTEDGAVHVQLSVAAADRVASVTVRSGVPAALARGHRELLTVRNGTRVLTERLLDATSEPVSVSLEGTPAASGSAESLFALGVGHILGGFDHLVFLAGLLLASRSVRELVSALTAFTVAHSITLAAAASGLVHAPPAIVEPLIAASIAWVGLETLFDGTARGPARRVGLRWLVVFAFGLVHGFGFAEALIDLGRWSSASEIAITLLSFNGGVEAGQLAVAAALLPLVWLVRARPVWNARLVPLCSAAIVAAGCYWLVERLVE